MVWIKRNLFFVISLGIALLLLAAAVMYDLQNLGHNSTAKDKLNEIYGTLTRISSGGKYSPGNDKINNVKIARDQAAEISNWIGKTGNYFKPIAPIPNSPQVTSEAFAAALRRTIDQLQRAASDANVELPPKYGFSFEAQRSTVKFIPESLKPLSVQLGEVKVISEILFAARVNAFDGVQRIRLSDDDASGPQADYINDDPTTNSLAMLTPYAVTFRSFSGELSSVLAGFAGSPHGFIIKGINVAPAGPAAQNAAPAAIAPVAPIAPPTINRNPYTLPPTTPSLAPAGRGGLPTVLNEQLLRVTLEVEIVKLSPKK